MCIKILVKAVFFLRWKYFQFNMRYWEKTSINTWNNKSRDWHIDGVANKSFVWFFMSTNIQKIPVKISWHSDVWSTSYSDLRDASLEILKTMDSKEFRVLIYHCFLMK